QVVSDAPEGGEMRARDRCEYPIRHRGTAPISPVVAVFLTRRCYRREPDAVQSDRKAKVPSIREFWVRLQFRKPAGIVRECPRPLAEASRARRQPRPGSPLE